MSNSYCRSSAPSGHWSVKFDPNYPITEMQTGESLYALALAGLEPDHPGHAPGDRRASGPAAGVRRLV